MKLMECTVVIFPRICANWPIGATTSNLETVTAVNGQALLVISDRYFDLVNWVET